MTPMLRYFINQPGPNVLTTDSRLRPSALRHADKQRLAIMLDHRRLDSARRVSPENGREGGVGQTGLHSVSFLDRTCSEMWRGAPRCPDYPLPALYVCVSGLFWV